MTLAERIDAAIEEAERMEEYFTKLEVSAYARGSYRVASSYADTATHYSERVTSLLKLKHDDGKEEKSKMKMTSFAFLMVLALQVQPASAQADRDEETKQDKAFRVLGWALMGTAATDVLSTQYSLRAGANESVPWVPEGGVGLVAAKSGAAAAAWWLTDRLHKDGHKKTALVTRIAIVALWGYVTVHNIRVGNELRETGGGR